MPDPTVHLAPLERRAATRMVLGQTFAKLGDLLANAKTVLTWLMGSIGAPAALVGLLVPIRESGSMLPQLWLTGLVGRFGRRKWAFLVGAIGQALACAAIAVVAVTLPATAAGVAIIAALGVLSLMRALSSIASKDVLGRTVPKGARGRVGGLAASLSGVVGAGGSVAAMIWMRESSQVGLYAIVIGFAGLAFALAGVGYALVDEPADDDGDADDGPAARVSLLWREPTLLRFVIARALLLGSALGGPFFVMFGQAASAALSNLAAFVLAGGAASALSSWSWARVADRSGNRAMAWGGALAAGVGAVAIVVRLSLTGEVPAWLWPALYFAFSVGYSGVRVGRKTYVVDVAEGSLRTTYVAASNTAIAIVLLLAGGLGAVVQAWSDVAALGMFTVGTAIGAVASLRLPERVTDGVPSA